MLRRFSVLLALTITLQAHAAPVTLKYKGVVLSAFSPTETPIRAGQEVTLSYTLDPSRPNLHPDAASGAGHYSQGVVSMRLAIPAARIDAISGEGHVFLYNDTAQIDSAQFFSLQGTEQISGERIAQLEINFIDGAAGPNGSPIMLSSSAIPAHPLVGTESNAFLITESTTSVLQLLLEPVASSPSELVKQGHEVISAAVAAGDLHHGHGQALHSKLSIAAIALSGGKKALACANLSYYEAYVAALAKTRRISSSLATDLRFASNELQIFGGC